MEGDEEPVGDAGRCACGGEVVEDGINMVCLACGRSVESACLARVAGPSERGWMVTDNGVDENNFRARNVLVEMADRLKVPDARIRADQAHGVMRQYELLCRVRKAAWEVRRRLGSAALAIAAESLDALRAARTRVEDENDDEDEDGRESAALGGCSEHDDKALGELAERVRARLDEEWQSELDASDWAHRHRAGDGFGLGAGASALPRHRCGGTGDEEADKRRHPSEMSEGFAALRMTVKQIRDDILQTSDDHPMCARVCATIQARLWKEPAIPLEGRDGHRQPANWPLFERSCADVNLSAERHRVFALLQRLAVEDSICRRRAKKQGFSWKSREGIIEAVAGAALFSVARKANIALRLEEVVNIGLPNEERRKKSGSREGDIQAIVEDMCGVGALDSVPALNTSHHLQQTASSLLQALGLLTGQGDSNRLLTGVMDVAVALYEQACGKGYTQGRRPQAWAAAVVVVGLHMTLLSEGRQKPTLDSIRDKACKVLSVTSRTIKDRITEIRDLLLSAAANAQLPFQVQKRNVWIHGKDVILHLRPPKTADRCQDEGTWTVASSTRMEPPSRKRDVQSEASALRALEWGLAAQHRAAGTGSGVGVVASGSGRCVTLAAPRPVSLEPCDEPAMQALIEMRREGVPLENIQPQMLIDRQRNANRKREREGSDHEEGGSGKEAGGHAQVIDEEALRPGGEYLHSEREVAQKKEFLDGFLDGDGDQDAAHESKAAKLAQKRLRRAAREGKGRAAHKQERQSDKVDYAKLQALLDADEI